VLQVLGLLVPLALANVVAKSTTLVERLLASSMPEGSISYLGYAFRLQSLFSLFIATGITTVVFPRMAVNVADEDLTALRRTMSTSLRFMWLAVAPATTLGMVLALPLVTVVFQRGQFNAMDAIAVAGLFQVYLLALASACLANITARGFYVLKDTRTVAVLGSIESIAYVLYTVLFARFFGTVGVALGYVLFFNLSFLWQVLIIRYKTGNRGGRAVLSSFARIGLAALLGGVAAWGVTLVLSSPRLQLVGGGMTGLFAYLMALYALRVSEAQEIWHIFFGCKSDVANPSLVLG
jgi:putative peptidoglycan lipid II flippase